MPRMENLKYSTNLYIQEIFGSRDDEIQTLSSCAL